ncbi:MAG TPA: STAS domain-containing protein [Candidatus Acidoferrales bacterium]|nr:STAS domain-containing protein [Candidatus Acidoferrales bacterium]
MQPSISVIKLTGELEIGRKAEVRGALQLTDEQKSILIDCGEVTYADSTALAELIRFRNQADARQVPVAILIGNGQFARLLDYAGLAQAFAVFDTRGAALAFLGSQTAGSQTAP